MRSLGLILYVSFIFINNAFPIWRLESALTSVLYLSSIFPLFMVPHINRASYLLTPWCRVPLEKLTGLQLVKKFPAFHRTRRFITALTSVHHLSFLGQPNQVHIPTSHLLEIHPNIIHPSMPRSPQWSLSLQQVKNCSLSSSNQHSGTILKGFFLRCFFI